MKKLLFTITSLVISAMLIGLMPLTAAQNSTDTTLPNWIKKNAKWWSDGSVDDKDFVQGIQYLIQKGIMKVNPPPTASKKQPTGYY